MSSDGTAHRLTGRAGKASAQLAELCDKYVVPEYKERVAHFFDLTTLARRMGAEETIAFEYPTADGNWHLARFIAKHREDDGTVGSVLYVTQLISDQKRREQFWIVAAEEANRASEAKSDFLSRMSHDIRTPMNAVMGLVSIARQHPEDRQKLLECINKIGVAGENLQQLVNDVLDMTQIERGEFAVNPQKMSLARVVKALNETLRDAAEAKALRFRCESHDIRRDCLVADPLRLHQVYMNLLSNAIKYTPAGGTVRFELYEEELPKDQKVKLTAVVADTGIGMDPAFMKVMYSKFSRAVDTRVNKVRGSGLGLAIVKQIVDLMHGTIDVQSTVGECTTFRVTLELPWGEGEPAPQDALEGAAADLDCRGIRLLVAEDNDLNYDIEAELLALYGMECVRAEDGGACVRRFREAPAGTFTAILMDMQMPVMDGLQAAAAIRALPRPDAGTIPIIAVTANAYQADVEKCLAAGMNDHLSKPLDVKKVIRTVKKCRK